MRSATPEPWRRDPAHPHIILCGKRGEVVCKVMKPIGSNENISAMIRAKRAEIITNAPYLEAERDYWKDEAEKLNTLCNLADVELDMRREENAKLLKLTRGFLKALEDLENSLAPGIGDPYARRDARLVIRAGIKSLSR